MQASYRFWQTRCVPQCDRPCESSPLLGRYLLAAMTTLGPTFSSPYPRHACPHCRQRQRQKSLNREATTRDAAFVRPDSGGGFGLAAKPLVCGSDSTLAVATFEPAHHEMRTRQLLEVVDEGVVHRCTTERADDRHGLRCELLRHYHAKAGCYLRNEPDQDRRSFREHPAFGDEARGLRDRFGEQPAGSEIPALRRIRLAIARAQSEYLEAGEGALRVREILALAARDVSDRPQHDDCRNRKFYRQSGETKAATHGPRRRRQCLMQQARCGLRLLLHGAKRDRERRLERLGGGGGDRLRRRLRERPAHQLDRLARDIAEAGSQARMLKRRRRRAQCVEVFFRHPDHCRHLSNTFSIALIRNGPAPIKVSRRCRCSDQPPRDSRLCALAGDLIPLRGSSRPSWPF